MHAFLHNNELQNRGLSATVKLRFTYKNSLIQRWDTHEILIYDCIWWKYKKSKTLRLLKNICISWKSFLPDNPAGIYLLKVNYRNTRTRYEICSKLTIKISGRRQWRRSGVLTVNSEHISHLVLVFLLLTLNMYLPNEKVKDWRRWKVWKTKVSGEQWELFPR